MKIGTASERYITVEVCRNCECQIEDGSGMCNYGCHLDGVEQRPKGQTIIRKYVRIDVLLSEEIV